MTRNIKAELQHIAKLLYKNGVCSNTSPIDKAIGNIKTNNNYNIEQLEISLPDIPRGTIPNGISYLIAVINVSITARDIINDFDIDHQFDAYNFNVHFIGYKNKSTYHTALHLDYDHSDKSEIIHPWFHLTFGSNDLKDKNHGELMLLPTPRVPMWPMDFFIGIDFILSNFLEKGRYIKNFAEDSHYKKSLIKSQHEIWRPYFLSIAHHWCKFDYCKHKMINTELSRNYLPTLIL